ncbi:putative bifunctional diguanylate cyclase/phosphodiesterase [Cellulomonas hominis]
MRTRARWVTALALPAGLTLTAGVALLDAHRAAEREELEVATELTIAATSLPTRLDIQSGIALTAAALPPAERDSPADWQRGLAVLDIPARSAATRAVLWVASEDDVIMTGRVSLAVTDEEPAAGTVVGARVVDAATFGTTALLQGAGAPELAEPLAAARDSGRLRLSEPFWAPGSGPSAAEVAVVAPVYAAQASVDTVAERRAAIQGWAVVALRTDVFLNEAMSHLHPGVVVVVSETVLGIQLAEFSTGGPVTWSEPPDGATVVDVPLLDRSWRLTGVAAQNVPWISLSVLVVGLLVTWLVVEVLVGRVRSEERALATVDARTRELETVTASTPDGLAWVDREGRLIFVNQAMVVAAGLPPQWEGRAIAELGGPDSLLRTVEQALADLRDPGRDTGPGPRGTRQVRQGDLWYEIRAVPGSDPGAGQPAALVIARDVTDYIEASESLAYAATHDPLTGLANRLLAEQRAELALALPGPGVVVLLLDLDRFKLLNDSYGHAVGDELLVLAARRVERLVPPPATVARLGGDEFVLVVPDTDRAQGDPLAGALVEAFDRPFLLRGEEFTVGCSIGVVHTDAAGTAWGELLRRADVAMYQAKAMGRGCYRWYEAGASEVTRERLTLAGELRRAMDNDDLTIAYQPEVDLRTGEVTGMEALMRWSTPTRGAVPPAEFIPVAEETGLIGQLGAWILRESLAQVAAHNRSAGADLRMWVNVSGRQLTGSDMGAAVRALLAELDAPARWLGIEVTESILTDEAHVLSTLVELRDLGVGIAIDDFGTGYSSLSRLRDYPVTLLKIDQSFVRGLGRESVDGDRRSATIVEAVVAVGRAIGADVLAEGIEQPEQRDRVHDLGCRLAQGYLLGRPGAFAEALRSATPGGRRARAVPS